MVAVNYSASTIYEFEFDVFLGIDERILTKYQFTQNIDVIKYSQNLIKRAPKPPLPI